MSRQIVNRGIDSSIFRYTAERTRNINVSPVVMRGGIRL